MVEPVRERTEPCFIGSTSPVLANVGTWILGTLGPAVVGIYGKVTCCEELPKELMRSRKSLDHCSNIFL